MRQTAYFHIGFSSDDRPRMRSMAHDPEWKKAHTRSIFGKKRKPEKVRMKEMAGLIESK